MLSRGVCWIRQIREGFLEEVDYELDLEVPGGLGPVSPSCSGPGNRLMTRLEEERRNKLKGR